MVKCYPLINNELAIFPFQNGIKLLPPTAVPGALAARLFSIAEATSLPFNLFLMDRDSKGVYLNEITAASMNLESPKDMTGKSMFHISPIKHAQRIIATDQLVMQTNRSKVVDDEVVLNGGTHLPFLTIKAPWYQDNGLIAGIIGCCIQLGAQPLADSLVTITQLGILNGKTASACNNIYTGQIINGVYLTKRQIELAHYLTKAKTAKSISVLMNLSVRTVEHYTDTIKQKLGAASKNELIEMLQDNLGA